MTEEIKPFGMLFEEPALELSQALVPFYDEDLGVSCIRTDKGQLIPYVELDENQVGTQTSTSIRVEVTDTDPQNDSPKSCAGLGTETFTEIQRETTDQDPSFPKPSKYPKRPLGTETSTKASSENTDVD